MSELLLDEYQELKNWVDYRLGRLVAIVQNPLDCVELTEQDLAEFEELSKKTINEFSFTLDSLTNKVYDHVSEYLEK